MIQLQDVQKSYGAKFELGPIHLEIPSSGITSIIGPNGAGKSSLLTMIGRLLKPDQGQILVEGMDVFQTDSADLARHLAILRQENHFVTRLTVRQLVAFGRYPYSRGRLTAEDERIIQESIDFMALTDYQATYLDELSGGQRQRAYVAMVLAQDTDYILLDEPLNNLDISRSRDMMDHLRMIADQSNRTILLVIHDLNYVLRYSDYVCAMKEGQVKAFGRIEEVLSTQLLSDIYDTPIDLIDGPYGPLAVY